MTTQALIDNIEEVEGQPDTLFHTFFTSNPKAALLACDKLGITPSHMLYRSKDSFVSAITHAPKKSMKKSEVDVETQAQVRYNMQERHRQLLFNDLFAVRQALASSGKVEELWRQREELRDDEESDLPEIALPAAIVAQPPPTSLQQQPHSPMNTIKHSGSGRQSLTDTPLQASEHHQHRSSPLTPNAPQMLLSPQQRRTKMMGQLSNKKGAMGQNASVHENEIPLFPAPPAQAPVVATKTGKSLEKEETMLYDALVRLTQFATKHAETEKRLSARPPPLPPSSTSRQHSSIKAQQHQTPRGISFPRIGSASTAHTSTTEPTTTQQKHQTPRALLWTPRTGADTAAGTSKKLAERLGSAKFVSNTARATADNASSSAIHNNTITPFNRLWSLRDSFNSMSVKLTKEEREQEVRQHQREEAEHRAEMLSAGRSRGGISPSKGRLVLYSTSPTSEAEANPENSNGGMSAAALQQKLLLQRTATAERQTAALLRVKMHEITAHALDEQRYRQALQDEDEYIHDEVVRQQAQQRRRAQSPSTYSRNGSNISSQKVSYTARRSSDVREIRRQMDLDAEDDRYDRFEVRVQASEEKVERATGRKKSKRALGNEISKAKMELILQNRARAQRAEEIRILALHHERESKRRKAEAAEIERREIAAKGRMLHEKEQRMRSELNEQIYEMDVKSKYYVPEVLAVTNTQQRQQQQQQQQSTTQQQQQQGTSSQRGELPRLNSAEGAL